MPSRSIAVTSNVVTPASARRASASSTGTPGAPGRQPCPTARPSRTSSATAIAIRAVRRDEAAASAGIREGGRPDDGPRRARPEHLVDRRVVAQPAGHLDARPLPHPGDDRRDQVELAGRRIARAVEVDDVEPSRPLVDEARGDRDRVVAVDRLAVEVAADEPHDAAAAQVDRGQQVEGARVVLARCHGSMIAL